VRRAKSLGFLQVVGGEHDRAAGVGLGLHRGPEGAPRLDVHRRGRLVEQEQVGVGEQGEGESEALLLAARASLDLPVGHALEPGPAEHVGCRGRRRVGGCDQLDGLAYREVSQEPTGLEDG
jgi:hypothetical protein